MNSVPTVLIIKSIKHPDVYAVEINSLVSKAVQDNVKYLNQRIYGVYDENGGTFIKKSINQIYKLYLDHDGITYSELDEDNKENEKFYLRFKNEEQTNGYKPNLLVSIYRKPNDCIVKTNIFSAKVVSLVKSIDKKNRAYNLSDKSWQIKGEDSIDKLFLSSLIEFKRGI